MTNYPIIEQLSRCESNYPPAICFVGTVTQDDNHVAVIESLTQVSALVYRMVVWEENRHTDELRRLSKRLAVEDRVEMLPRMSQAELLKLHNTAMAGIITRRYIANYGFRRGSEGIIKFYEYLANGLPVICTNYDIWREIVNEYDCGICVEPDSVGDIVRALKYLIANPDRAKQMGKNARRAAVERYNWTSQERKYLNVYGNLITGSGAGVK